MSVSPLLLSHQSRVSVMVLTEPYSFLDDISRITKLRYEPTSDDVVKARLRTMGVQEYKFIAEKVEKENLAAGLLNYGSSGHRKSTQQDNIKRSGPFGLEPGREWIIYDVGGARSNVCLFFQLGVCRGRYAEVNLVCSDKRGYRISRT